MGVIRSGLYYVGATLATIFFSLTGLLLLPTSFHFRFRFMVGWAHFSLWWLALTCRIHYEVEGLERIPPGPCIVLAKHQSAWETIAFQAIFPAQTWVLKRELLYIPFFGWGLIPLEPIAIDRKAGRKALSQVITQGIERIQRGIWIIVFPEGTRTAPGTQGTYNIGGAKLAEEAAVPVVPVAHNAGVFWPRQSWIKRPGTIRVVIGPTIATEGRKASQILRQAEGWIEETCAQLPLTP